MTQKYDSTKMYAMLWELNGMEVSMLAMLEWLCGQIMKIEISAQVGVDKNEQSKEHSSYRSCYRPRHLDTQMRSVVGFK